MIAAPRGVGTNTQNRAFTERCRSSATRGTSGKARHEQMRSGSLAKADVVSSNQLQRLQAHMPVLADDQVVMHRDPERLRHVDDRLRHLDIGRRWRRIAGRVIVQEPANISKTLILDGFAAVITAGAVSNADS
jgi:hypothetical protein